MNDVGLNLVELRATKGGEVAAFRRSFRFVGFPDVWGGRLESGGKKRRERGLKWGIGACRGRRRGAGRAFGAVSHRPWGVWWVFDWVQLYGGAEWRLMDV